MSLDAKIRAHVDDPVEIVLSPGLLADAIRSVVNLHTPITAQSYYGDTRLCCKRCHQNGQTPQWPCATVKAIAAALGVES